MRTRLIFLILFIANFSCTTTNKPVTDAEKEMIKGEIKEVVNSFIRGAEEANLDLCLEPLLDSPDFIYIYNGNIFSYQELMDFRPVYASLINQKFTIVDEKYAFLDNPTILYTLNVKVVSNYKDGHSEFSDPCVFLFIFEKIDSKWKVISLVESSVIQSI